MNSHLSRDESQQDRELLAGLVLGDLTDDEQRQANKLIESDHWRDELEELEIAAAAVSLSAPWRSSNLMPEQLRERALLSATSYFNGLETPTFSRTANVECRTPLTAELHSEGVKAATADRPTLTFASKRDGAVAMRERLAWMAFAASLLLAIGSWVYRPTTTPATALTLQAQREILLNDAGDALTIAWSEGKTPLSQPVRGDVVWSQQKQSGFMRFVGLPVNDPTVEQYQLWIIDPARDAEPIDGGVFDIDAPGEVVVQINPKLKVLSPAAFAITIEKPGGVVVSDQGRLPLIAAVQ